MERNKVMAMLYGMYNNRYKCRLCRANLDPGEKCDCQHEKAREQEERDRFLATGNDGQLYIRSVWNEQKNVRGTI